MNLLEIPGFWPIPLSVFLCGSFFGSIRRRAAEEQEIDAAGHEVLHKVIQDDR